MNKIKLIENDNQHHYKTIFGVLPSSTTILSILRKPAIEVWMLKTTCEYLGSKLSDIKSGKLELTGKNAYRILQEAKLESTRIKNEAGSIGTEVHKMIEIYLNNSDDYISYYDNDLSKLDEVSREKVKLSFDAFLKWKAENYFEVIDTELSVYSKIGYAGTLDAVGYYGKSKKLFVLDFKTSGGFWEPEYCMQLSSYRKAYEEIFNEKVRGMGILRLDKNDGMPYFKEYTNKDYRKHIKAFKHLVSYYNIIREK